MNIVLFKGSIENSYNIIDTGMNEIQRTKDGLIFTTMIVSYDNPGSFSNIVDVYSVSLNVTTLKITTFLIKLLCTYEMKMDTFLSN